MKYSDNIVQAIYAVRPMIGVSENAVRAVLEALESTAEQKALRADAERLDKLQDLFINGDEFLVRFCISPDDVDCDNEEHPHFEAFEWGMENGPVTAKTLREAIDKARGA